MHTNGGSFLGWRLRTVLVGCIVSFAFLGTMALAGEKSDAERAEAWAARGSGSGLSTLGELAAYPQAYRFAAFKRLDAATKASLWREQLRWYLATTTGLTARQTEFVQAVLRQASPEIVAKAVDTGMCGAVKSEFTDMSIARPLRAINIAAYAIPSPTFASRWVSLKERIIANLTVHADESQACDCYNTGWCECVIHECCYNAVGWPRVCTETGTSCGCWWETEHQCNGKCQSCPYLG